MRLSLYEILDKVSKLTKKEQKIEELRKHDSNVALKILLKMAFDKNLKWALPEGDPPYKPCILPDQEGMLYNEVKRLYLFHEGGNPNLKQIRRESMFIQILESITANDAKLLLGVKNKKLPWKGITQALVDEAYSGLLIYG